MKKLLKDITLVAVDCTDRIENTMGALRTCQFGFDFASVKIFSHKKPVSRMDNVDFIKIPEIKNINEYNEFMFLNLGEYIFTSHALTVQDHAYIINPIVWKDEWLNYDYIGAPWAISENSYICRDTGEHVRVGNGGFSLRSRRLMLLPKRYNLPLLEEQGWFNEDGNICVYHRKRMLELGVRYAPLEVAAGFSFENYIDDARGYIPFGFHRNIPGGGLWI